MREADRLHTLADLTGRPLTPFGPSAWRSWSIAPRLGRATAPDLAIPLGGGIDLEAFCTPGHSPDSVTWRVNRMLFAGDLLAATAPLVAGIAGWSRDALLDSLARLEQLVADYAIEWVHVGHGKPLDRAGVAAAIARSRDEALGLSRVDPVNVQRVRHLAARADELAAELEELFAEIARRIRQLADKLAQIQESRAADEVRAIDRSREVAELLEAFELFKETTEARGDGALGVAAKGIQTALRISKLLEWERLDDVLDESFLRYARTRVVDFIQRAKGLAVAVDAVHVDLGAWARAFAKRLDDQRAAACRLDDVSGGEAGFRRQLVRCMARTPSLGTASLALSVDPGAMPARLDPIRFGDALVRVIEDQVSHGAAAFALQVGHQGAGTVLTVVRSGSPWVFAEERVAAWTRLFARGGAQIEFPPSGSPGPLAFAFEPQ